MRWMNLSRSTLSLPAIAACILLGAGLAIAQNGDLRRCQQRFEISASALLERELDQLQTCSGAVLNCIENEPGEKTCLEQARAVCATELGWMEGKGIGPAADLAGQVAADCAGLPVEQLLAPEGLGHGAASCLPYTGGAPATLESLALCVAGQHACQALGLVAAEAPRTAELLALGGVDTTTLACLDQAPTSKGSGLLTPGEQRKIWPEEKRVRRSVRAARAVTDCQAAIAWTGLWYARDYLKHIRPCLDTALACAVTPEGVEGCSGEVAELCAVQMEQIRGGARSLETAFVESVGSGCRRPQEGGGVLPLDLDLFDDAGLGFAALEERCVALGSGRPTNLDELTGCLLAEHRCRLEQIVARQVPRVRELFELAGVDTASMNCLGVAAGAVCGDGEQDPFEECDPPGTQGSCGEGLRCGGSCTCVASGPPVIHVPSLEYSVVEGQSLAIPVTADDPDGQVVSLAAEPLLPGASFEARPGVEASGSFQLRPGYEQQGLSAVRLIARDPDGLTDEVTVRLTIADLNRPPSLEVPEQASVDEGEVLTVPVRGEDPDGDLLTYSNEGLPPGAVFVPATGTLTFAPAYDQAGVYDITFDVTDGQAWAGPQVLTITVDDVATGGEGQPRELVLEVDEPESPTLLETQTITGRVNPTGEEPPPARIRSALITGVHPAAAAQGKTLDVALEGEVDSDHATHFLEGSSQVDFGPGITVTAVSVASASSLRARISISSLAGPGPRQILVTTGDEVAVCLLAFNVLPGSASVTGRLVDAATGAPISGGEVSLFQTPLTVHSGPDGEFFLGDAPAGSRKLVISAADHALYVAPIDVHAAVALDLGQVELQPVVFDPAAPAGASLHSILGRGVADLTGRLSVEEARRVIRDTLILTGGNEAGVLDAYGNQLNPNVEGDGLMSLTDGGVDLYAQRMAKGEDISLIKLLSEIAFAFEWSGGPPRLEQMLERLQQVVDDAWAHPNDPRAAATIAIFNPDGHRLSPNPPRIDGNNMINRFQAYLAMGGFMGELSKRWEAARKAGPAPKGPHKKDGEEKDSGYTATWDDFLSAFDSDPTGPSSPGAAGGSSELPDFEELLEEYYLDHSEASLEEAKEMLLDEFPGYGLEDLFEEDPYGVKRAYDDLLRISEHDQELREKMIAMTDNPVSGSSPNFWHAFREQKGSSLDEYFSSARGFFPREWKRYLVSRSWAPSTPVVYLARETTTEIGPPGSGIRVPAARVLFFRSGDDQGAANPSNVDYHYRLWRIEAPGSNALDPAVEMPGQTRSQLVMVGFGEIEEHPAGPRRPRTPDPALVPSASQRARMGSFVIPLPPLGMNYYRIDVVRRRGDGTVLGKLDPKSADFQQAMKPWLAGFDDEPLAFDPLGLVGRRKIHPGQGFLDSYEYEISPLSSAVSVYVAGPGSIGRVDLAADYHDPQKVYVSVPSLVIDESSRGSGSVFRLDPATGELIEWVRPGFLSPGQAGLAIDDQFNLYTDNAASDPTFGGRVFRYLGYRGPDDPPYEPKYPTSGDPASKQFVGQVNYYSKLLSRAQPASVRGITMGPASSRNVGPELYIAEGMNSEIKRLAVQGAEFHGWDPWHNSAKRWAWNSKDASGEGVLAFDADTDLAFDPAEGRLYITQGPRVVRSKGGEDASQPITTGGSFFFQSSGAAVCDARGGGVLFVSDFGAPGEHDGRIYRFPVEDLPIILPEDEQERAMVLARYRFLSGLNRPGDIRITDSGNAFLFADAKGIRYQDFGFTGRATGENGLPLAGAVVTIKTLAGTQSTIANEEGFYNFSGETSAAEAVVYATVTHPDRTYMERVSLQSMCNANSEPAPCVSITSPADGAWTASEEVEVRGVIFPLEVDFSRSGGHLDLTHDGETTTYPLSFDGEGNAFTVAHVRLEPGDSFLVARVNATGEFASGSSLTTKITSTTAEATTQAAAGVLTDENGHPRAGVLVEYFVDGEKAAESHTDECGYYTRKGLPLGELTLLFDGEPAKGAGR